jgi:D-3-phosphoglycerate dehydrogenase / 2-oxoglutarate reductase
MPVRKVVLIDTVHPALQEVLQEYGFSFVEASLLNGTQLSAVLTDAEGMVIRSRIPVNDALLANAPRLKFIARAGAGMENIDSDAAAKRNIVCINAPEGNRDAVGEHALAMLLCLLNRIKIADAEVRSGIWKRHENRSTELMGKTVAIIGFGNMGSAFAKRLRGFDCNVIAYDKYIQIKSKDARQVQMQEVFDHADIVSLHVPLTQETHHLIGKEYIYTFKKDFYLINTARGPVCDTSALVDSLRSGKIKGACLDVIEFETTSFESLADTSDEWNYLSNSDRVILTPHIAGWSIESHERISRVLAKKILKLYDIKSNS